MQISEREIHFSRWIFHRKEKNWFHIALISLTVHAFIFLVVSHIKPPQVLLTDQNPSSIKINIQNSMQIAPSFREKSNIKRKINKHQILTDTHTHSQSQFFENQEKSKELDKKNEEKSKQLPNELSSFLPNSNMNYLNSLRQQKTRVNDSRVLSGGDTPIEGPSLAPTNDPPRLSRFVEKDMSLLQFTQEFRERFSAVWNAQERIVPPSSPLRPGDVVYYRVYIKSNGLLEKYENLSQNLHPLKNYVDIDQLFLTVLNQVFPMSVPPKFANKDIILTQDLAIQVVGRNQPIQFSF